MAELINKRNTKFGILEFWNFAFCTLHFAFPF
jgi:hypothetical protein